MRRTPLERSFKTNIFTSKFGQNWSRQGEAEISAKQCRVTYAHDLPPPPQQKQKQQNHDKNLLITTTSSKTLPQNHHHHPHSEASCISQFVCLFVFVNVYLLI